MALDKLFQNPFFFLCPFVYKTLPLPLLHGLTLVNRRGEIWMLFFFK